MKLSTSRHPWEIISCCVALCVALLFSVAIFQHSRQPWVEIVGKDVLRTTAPKGMIAHSRDAVIENYQNKVLNKNGQPSDPSYQGGGRSWRVGDGPEAVRYELTRGKTQITDKNGFDLSIEVISQSAEPTLIFLSYGKRDGVQDVMNNLVIELQRAGVHVIQ